MQAADTGISKSTRASLPGALQMASCHSHQRLSKDCPDCPQMPGWGS